MNTTLENLIGQVQNPLVRQVLGVASLQKSKKIHESVTDGGLEIVVNYILRLQEEVARGRH